MKFIPAKLAGVDTTDMLLAGGVKYFTERFLAGYIGNGTLISGGVKIVASQLAKDYKPLSLALAIDGAEDVTSALIGGLGSGNIFSALGGNANAGDMVI